MAKYAPKEGLLYSLVMVPNRVDKHGHWETPEDVQNACHSWAEEGCVLDLNHADPKLQGKDLLRSDAVAVENLIVQEGDIRFKGILIDGEEVDPTGGWGYCHPDQRSWFDLPC
jgi:hypothetical protein